MLSVIRRKIQQLIFKIAGRAGLLKNRIKCKHVWYGNTYGGFFVCPELLNKNSIVYSFGIGEDISFDLSIINNHDCKVFGFDPTPKSIDWVNKQTLPSKFTFFEYGINSKSGLVDFYLPRNPSHVSGSYIIQSNVNLIEKIVVKMKSLNDIISELGHDHIDLLKLDIEGAEYDVIKNILTSNISIGQILIEFHQGLVMKGKQKTLQAVKLLRNSGYEIFAISDSFEEFSFVKKEFVK